MKNHFETKNHRLELLRTFKRENSVLITTYRSYSRHSHALGGVSLSQYESTV